MLDLEKKVLLGRSVGDNTDREQKMEYVLPSSPEAINMVVRNKKTSTAITALSINDLKLKK